MIAFLQGDVRLLFVFNLVSCQIVGSVVNNEFAWSCGVKRNTADAVGVVNSGRV